VSTAELFRLGRLALSIDPALVANCTIPTGGGSGGNLGVAPEAGVLFADFRDDGVAAFCDPMPGGFDAPSPG
jgi:hypothetical protein